MMKKSLSLGLAVLLILAAVMVAVPVQVTAGGVPRLSTNTICSLLSLAVFVN
mgnify:CR=1 FL=1